MLYFGNESENYIMLKAKIVRNPLAKSPNELCVHLSGVDCVEIVDAYSEYELRELIVDLEGQIDALRRQKRLEKDASTPNLFSKNSL